MKKHEIVKIIFKLRTIPLIIIVTLFCQSQNSTAALYSFRLLTATPGTIIIERPNKYDYVPTIIQQNNISTIWWCGAQGAGTGDTIFSAKVPAGKLEKMAAIVDFQPVFSSSGNPSTFDGQHTCDPSIVEVNNRLYLYHGGLSQKKTTTLDLAVVTKIGVASSDDGGKTWNRANQGKPILIPRVLQESDKNRYGIGQPSVVYHGGLFHLFYTNSVGPDGPGIYLIRSKTPLLTDAEEWTVHGFVPLKGNTPKDGNRFIQGASADWAFLSKYAMFMMALRKKEGIMQLLFFDETLQTNLGEVELPIEWTEGPGLVRDEKGNLIVSDEIQNSFSFYLLRSTGTPRKPATWDISASKIQISISRLP
jgi:hypothetical protein